MRHKHRGNRRLVTVKKAQHKLDIIQKYGAFTDIQVPSYGILDKAKVSSCGVVNPKTKKRKSSNSKKFKTASELISIDRFVYQLNDAYEEEAAVV